MAVSVSSDLSVTVGEDVVADKLPDKQTLMKNFQKVQSKALGVSQLMLGLLVMINSIPLLCTDFTEVVTFGVPLWSGLVFVIAGSLATMMEKYTNKNYLYSCIAMSVAAMLASTTALIIYFIDITRHQAAECARTDIHTTCVNEHYTVLFSIGVKTSLALYTLIHAIISAILTHSLNKARKNLGVYTIMCS
ncbi:transmembrane protein 176 isoform X2 [Clupea harengus]|uniref:Transmembrane protein 176 isoform X2 n=1 Tax=Clupea harengus TaxID=7950 RepID=A0A6P3W964_CLUHA|nr:transmembrane protein 176 isoform X2 [Clupea harengus]